MIPRSRGASRSGRTASRALAALAWGAALLAAPPAAGPGATEPGAQAAGPAPRLIVASDGGGAWVLDSSGALVRCGGPAGDGATVLLDGRPARFADVDLSRDGRTLHGLVVSEDARSTDLVSFDARDPGAAVSRHAIRGEGRFLKVTGGGLAAVVTRRPTPGRPRAGEDDADAWTLTVVELATGRLAGPARLGCVPAAVALAEPPESPPRLLVASEGKIVSFGLDPPRASWFYKSPGAHAALLVSRDGTILCALREGRLILVDPARRPRGEGRVQLTDDDATLRLELPSPVAGLALSGDGRTAAALHQDGATLSLVDLVSGEVVKQERLAEPRTLIAPELEEGADGRLIARVAARPAQAPPDLAEIFLPRPAPPPVPEPPHRVEPPPAEEAVVSPAPPARQEEERASAPPVTPAPVIPPPVSPPPVAEPVAAAPPEPAPVSPPPVAPERSVDQATLSGRITGAGGAAEDVFYGPGNLLKLQARAPVGPDGLFRIPVPPAGTYRVVVRGTSGAHLFTRPEFRTIVVEAAGRGIEGIDFEVRGRL